MKNNPIKSFLIPLICILKSLVFFPVQSFVLLSDYTGYSYQYEIGTTYSYSYVTEVLFNEPKKEPAIQYNDVGFKLVVPFDFTAVWQDKNNLNEQIIQIQLSRPTVMVKSKNKDQSHAFIEKQTTFSSIQPHPFFIHRKEGTVDKIYISDTENLSLINLQKGIASLFQYSSSETERRETDTSGNCEVSYEKSNKVFSKVKQNCLYINDKTFFNTSNKVMSAFIESRITNKYEISSEGSPLYKVDTFEVHTFRPEIYRKSGVEVLSQQHLILKGSTKSALQYEGSTVRDAISSLSKVLKTSLVPMNLEGEIEPKECILCKELSSLVDSFRNALRSDNLGSKSSAVAFLRILHKMRISEYEKIRETLGSKKNAKILPQLLDIAAATQTVHSYKAARKVLESRQNNADLFERYLYALSVATHPSKYVLEDLYLLLKKGIKNEKLYSTLVLSLCSQVNTYSSNNPNSEITREITLFVVNALKNCRSENCQLLYINGLKNLGQPSTIPVLLQYIRSKNKKPSTYAIKALKSMPREAITEDVLRTLERVFLDLDAKFDTSVRAAALSILLQHKSNTLLIKDVFDIISRQKTREFNTLLVNQICDLDGINDNLKPTVQSYLNSHFYANYHSLGQGGMSSMYSRPLMKSEFANASFSSVLEMQGGLLKRSSIDVFASLSDEQVKLLSFDIFAGGMSMFSSEPVEDDNEETNAGLEISLLSSQLRPFYLFTSNSELMGHVWSGTGSERTTALQGSGLLQDHNQHIVLQNGFAVNFILTGAVSYDIAGQGEVSLWNKNAHSQVEVGAAFVLQGQARLDNSFTQTMVEFNVGSQATLKFLSDLTFADEIMMCTQMIQPSTEIIENLRKMERVADANYVLRKFKRKAVSIPGRTYAINKKNSEICNKMFS